jgi:hypothetical protein
MSILIYIELFSPDNKDAITNRKKKPERENSIISYINKA